MMKIASNTIRIAGRGSKLALTQSQIVSDLLTHVHPGLEITVEVVRTKGDGDPRPFAEIGGKGLFTSEVERALVEDRADIAVHSAKDLTAELADGCRIACIPARAARHDVVVGGVGDSGEERLGALPPGARVGTSSMRRRSLLGAGRPDLEAVELRGNVDTRLRKVASGEVDVAILAAAGLRRLGLPEGDEGALAEDAWIPAPGQGALAIECLSSRADLIDILVPLNDPASWAEVMCERAFASRMEGGCSVPLGCLARAGGNSLAVTGFLGMPDGSHTLRDRISGPLADAESLGRELADAMIACGGSEILEEVREWESPQISPP